ncbi:hypothetical protein DTL42_07800 [Bremerella cremea]|uniref:Uncharacterized protein n=1 Tax=Bremerella cremea TaxID=1031537 RepID=A0A368KVH5_9BACT|nr:hypothetical protein [Bremerella cremea]RCS52731.1 hypothetical protein DTL42_07800 [Bremerella cremea]
MPEKPESNPFTSPHGDDEQPSTELSSIPGPMAVAMLLGYLLMLLQVGEFVLIGDRQSSNQFTLLVGAVLSLFITSGLIARSGPTWALARFYFCFHGLMAVSFAIMAYSVGKPPLAIWSGLVQAAFCLFIFLALGRPTVRKYHQLECPQCHKINANGDDLLCFQRRCRSCGFRW